MDSIETRGGRMLNNYVTESRGRVDSDKAISPAKLDELLQRARRFLNYDELYSWDANINGIIVRLITNSWHQYDFWVENWWPGPNDDSVKPHAFIYSVQGVPNEKPFAYYGAARDTAVFINTEYYGQCKSWALGIAAKILEERFHTHSIHGACAEIDGRGVAIVAPTGTGKTTQVNKLFQHPKGKVIGDDWIYIKIPTENKVQSLIVTQPERKLYIRTENALTEEWLRPILDRCKCENVCTNRQECTHPPGEECGFDMGLDKCYWGFPNARAMLPREWMKGTDKVGDRATLKLIVLLRRDETSPAEVHLNDDQAIEVLKKGEYMIRPGAGPKEKWGTMGYEPWYNPYLLVRNDALQEYFFRRELEVARCILLNTGAVGETIERTHQRILQALDHCADH
jgi:hypothetical protein